METELEALESPSQPYLPISEEPPELLFGNQSVPGFEDYSLKLYVKYTF